MIGRQCLRRVILAGVLVAGALAPAAAAPSRKAHTILIDKMAFGPIPAGLRVGDTVEWVNNDIFVHSATAQDKSFDIELKPRARARMVLKKAGQMPFSCRYHPGMKGRLDVAK